MKVWILSFFLFSLQLLLVSEGAYDYGIQTVAESQAILDKTTHVYEKLVTIIADIKQLSCKSLRIDFENGIRDWTKTGTAFNNQPTYGDNPTARNRGQPAQQQGDWWIGGAEDRPSPCDPAGKLQDDEPTGTLTSPVFQIPGQKLSFLIGGGCEVAKQRVELVVGGQVVENATGKCHESMERRFWDVSAYEGQDAQIRLVDDSSGTWGHINFDDLRCV